jgi:hypothetical protein
MRSRIYILIAIALASCQRDAPKDDSPTSQPPVFTQPAASTPPAMPKSSAKLITHEGILEMARVPGGKAFQPTTLLLEGGHELLLSYRPMPAYFHLVGARVLVTGAHQKLSQNIQQVGGDHFTADTITPADQGEYAHRDDLPPTPLFATHDQAPKLHKRWVHVHGTFDEVEDDDLWKKVAFKMKADDPIKLHPSANTFDEDWAPLRGKNVTVVGELYISQEGETRGDIMVLTPMLLCEGHKPGCASQ